MRIIEGVPSDEQEPVFTREDVRAMMLMLMSVHEILQRLEDRFDEEFDGWEEEEPES